MSRVEHEAGTERAWTPSRRRWLVCALLFGAIVLSYLDRQVLSVLKPYLQHRYDWSEVGYANVAFWFQAVYGVGYLLFGRVVDRVGERVGFAAAGVLWAAGQAAHALARTTTGFALARVPLALGESGAFPSALSAVAAWFPRRERALAIGLFNAGSNIGAIIAPLAVPAIVLAFGWRAAFVATGVLTAAWALAWLWLYRRPRADEAPEASAGEAEVAGAPAPGWRRLIGVRASWAYAAGRFLIDPVWWTFLFWLPDFLTRRFGVDLKGYGPLLAVVYVMADGGSILGGWLSSRLARTGLGLGAARKAAMTACAVAALPVAFADRVGNVWAATLLIGLACAAHQGFSANLYALPTDLLPRRAVGTVAGFGGLSGALGGMLMAEFTGRVLQRVGDYGPIFAVAGSAYVVALIVVHLLAGPYRPVVLDRPAAETPA